MNRPFVDRLRIQNFGCVKDATFQLTPLHALIGPNDSGKSTVLRALEALSGFAHVGGGWDFNPISQAFRAHRSGGSPRLEVSVGPHTMFVGLQGQAWVQDNNEAVRPGLTGCQMLRLDPEALRQPSQLIQDGQELRLQNDRGAGLPAVYDAIITRDVNAYVTIGKRLTELFPSVKTLSLKNPTQTTKAMGILLKDGTAVPATTMSEGLLYWLAFAALPYLAPTALILVEEPENGLHPARIRDVMRVLRDISQTTQVMLATHSPLVINELEGNEVTVVTRGPEGTKATLIKDTPDFDQRSKAYSLGELWVSYANGDDEGPLLRGGPRP